METVLFTRVGFFYPVEFMNEDECGKTLKEQAKEHAELNPGTIRVEDINGNILWQLD